MDLKTKLRINNETVATFDLKKDRKITNRYVIRSPWLQNLSITESDKVFVTIESDGDIITTFDLKYGFTDGKKIWTSSKNCEERYAWGTLSHGYGRSYALTVGIMLRRKAQQSVDIPSAELTEGAGILN